MVIVVMGASGSGKTTVGRALAAATGWTFVDGDDLHPRENVEKMARSEPLTDADRGPWLKAVRQTIDDAVTAGASRVVACSALKRAYRHTISHALDDCVRFVYLKAPTSVLKHRLATRRGHFASPTLLSSQLGTLEEPTQDEALILDASLPPAALVNQIARTFDFGTIDRS